MADYRDIIQMFQESIALTEYGYWIDPKGDIHPVGRQEHKQWITENLGIGPEEAMQGQWIRVIAYCDWLACEYRARLYPRTARAIKKLAASQQWANYTLENEDHGNKFETTDRIKFLTAVEAAVERKPNLTEDI